MKTKQEQIEEMAKFMHYKAHGKDKNCDNEKCEMCWCSCKNDAELLYSAGYRKASDTAREILQMIKDKGLFRYGGYLLHDSDFDTIGKLYGVEVEE